MKVKTKLCATALAVALGVGLLAGCQVNNSSRSGNSGGASTSQDLETKYFVNVSQSSDYTVSGLNAEGYLAGAKVTFTVTPADGKELVSVGYDQVDITPKADGSYEFNMPEKNVTLIVTVRAIAQYDLSYTGTLQVDGGPVTFSLKLGTDPVPGFELEEIAGKDLVDIDGVEVTGKAAGTTTIIAKVNNEEKARKEVTVLASELMSVKAALDAAIIEAPCNGSGGNNSAKTNSNYTIAGQVIAMSNYDDSGAMSVVIDDGTAAALLVVYSSSKTAPDWAVGDSVKTTCKFTNYYGLLEGINTTSTATKQNSLYPDQIVKIEKAFTPSLAQATAMTGAQYLEYVALATANQSATAGKWTPLKRVSIDVTYDKDHDMGGGNSGGYVIDGATEYAIHAAELSRIELDSGNGHKSTLSGILTGVNSTRKTSKIFADTQTPLAVETITFKDGNERSIFLNNPVTLEYTAAPQGSYGEETWTSSNPSKVKVEAGVVTGLEQGSSTITLTINGVSKSINIVVSGEQHPCESVTLDHDTLTVPRGTNKTLVATITPNDCTDTVSWASDKPAIATVDENGKVVGVSNGTATITVTCGAKSATCAVTVRDQKIADLADAKVGDPVDVKGYITAQYPVTSRSGLWICDGNRGIFMYKKLPTGMNIGDAVSVVGTVAANHGAKQVNGEITKLDSVTGLDIQPASAVELTESVISNITSELQGAKATVTGVVKSHSNINSTTANHTIVLTVGNEEFKVYGHKDNDGADALTPLADAVVGRTVTFSGFVTANKTDETDFTKLAKSDYQLIRPTLDDFVAPEATGIELNKTTAEVEQGKTLQLTATATPKEQGAQFKEAVSWSVTGNSGVTVDQNGLVTVASDASTSETATVKATYKTYEATCVITVKTPIEGIADELDRAFTGVADGATSYSDWSGKTGTSGAVYAGNSAGSKDSIQLRSKNSNSGIVSTKSGGKIKKVIIEWQADTLEGRTLDIYGANAAYTAPSQLYDNATAGTKLGSIVCGTSTELTVTGDYTFIGLRSKADAMYITSITIIWDA